MIKKFIEKVFGSKKSRKTTAVKERIYARDEHGIRRDELSNAAISVCEGLHRAGYKAFVVGGAVRDLLLKRHPANRVAPFSLGVPVVGLATGMLVLDETITLWQWGGIGLLASALVSVMFGGLVGRRSVRQ